jgi:hypothetical protein
MNVYNLVINSSNVVGSNNNIFKYNFLQGSFEVSEDAEICISSATIPYSWFNITQYYNNNSFSFKWDTTTFTVNFPSGFYSIEDINYFIQQFSITNNLYLINNTTNQYYYFISIYTNTSYYANQFILQPIPTSLPSGFTAPSGFLYSTTGNTPQIIISSTNNFGSIIGFTGGNYPISVTTSAQSILGNTTPNATPVNSLIILCDLVNNPCATPSIILDTIPINVKFGSQINYVPSYEKWVGLSAGNYANLSLFITDQNFRPIPANDPNVCISLLIRNKKQQKTEENRKKINSIEFKDLVEE